MITLRYAYSKKESMIKIGDRIEGKYRIRSFIGTGGMAHIYEASDLIRQKECVVKIMLPELIKDPNSLERFKREAKIESNFNHPNIVEIWGYGEIENRPYYVMELIKGQTIRQKLKFGYSFSLKETLDIGSKVASALSYVHQRGIVHADIKPDNIYILQRGEIKIFDFGIAFDENEKDFKKDVVGSPFYLAPEITLNKEYSARSDIYALGVTLYEMITNSVPFKGIDPYSTALAHTKEEFPKITDIDKTIPHEVEDVILKCCEKNPDNRFQSADEIVKAVESIDKKKIIKRRSLISKIFGFKE